MIAPLRTLDCARLEPGAPARLTDADLRRIAPLQQVLLSPLDHPTVDDWRRAVNRALMAAFGSDAAMFQLDLEGVELQYSDEFGQPDVGEYVQELMPQFARDRRLFGRALERGAGNRSILWAEHLEWLYRSDYFNELVRRMQAYDPLWVAAPVPGGRYPAMLHTYHDRRRSHHFFDAADVTLMAVVQPALEAGVRAVARAGATRASLVAAFDASRDGTLVYAPDGRLLHGSRSVAQLVQTRATEEAVLSAARHLAQGMLADDGARTTPTAPASRMVSTRAGEYHLSAVLLGEGAFTPGRAVLVTLSAGEAPLADRGTLRERYGLTRRQAEVALLLARRRTNPEIAEELCISEHTVRSHAEAVMAKIGVRDRREIRPKLTAA